MLLFRWTVISDRTRNSHIIQTWVQGVIPGSLKPVLARYCGSIVKTSFNTSFPLAAYFCQYRADSTYSQINGYMNVMSNSGQLSIKIITRCLLPIVLFCMVSGNGWGQETIATASISDREQAALYPSRELIEFGRIAAEANCSACHGIDGISDEQGKPHLAGQRVVYIYRVLRALQSGQRIDDAKYHNSFLNDQVLLSTAVFYSNLSPAFNVLNDQTDQADDNSEVSADDPYLAIRDSMRKCVKCHGETGNSARRGMPSLTAQHPDYFISSMVAYVDGSRQHKLMGKLVGQLDEATIRQMGNFYAVQEPVQTETLGEGDVIAGQALSQKCASCHGDDGNAAKGGMPTLAGQDAKYFVKGMNHYKNGERQHKKMFEAAEQLSEKDMLDLASFYAAQQPRRRNVRRQLDSKEWIARCERCHGIDGNSRDPRFPMLAGQDEAYLIRTIKAYASGARENSTMHAMATPLNTTDIERIAGHFAKQQPKAAVYMQLPCNNDN
jgi:cytochrome c553